ncbi:sperm acrosome membrane-associated protein 6 [Terrapene carolina triunguis]|uniref:sperm acrosome membrane-associated protein 6 n=1 Tax=Terrapene triunguis TaxID=2587831 RepID=UPI000E779CFC|nr:sperm acrosome membrane-associated protein 6 [Terrapene carolina triunguis]
MPVASQLLLPLCLSLLAPRAPGCLDCFSTPQQRLRVCQVFLGHTSSRHVACLGALRAAFQPHTQLVVVAAFESAQPPCSAHGPEFDSPDACPPSPCHPLNLLSPAPQLRTRDLSLFRDLHPGASSSIVLRPTWGSHRGTYACQLAQEDDVLARNYFYLNVTASSQGAETELQDMFRAILQSPAGQGAEGRLPGLSELLAEPDSLHKRNVVLLMVGLALSALLGTLLLGGICRWAMGWP